MNDFTSRYSDRISGVLSGFDRLVFRGNLSLNHEAGMKGYLGANGIPWKDYPGHVTDVSQRVKQASLAAVEAAHRPIQYLSSGTDSKEQLAVRSRAGTASAAAPSAPSPPSSLATVGA